MLKTMEEEKRIEQIRVRFCKLHGQKKWYRFCKYTTHTILGPTETARILEMSIKTIIYWRNKLK